MEKLKRTSTQNIITVEDAIDELNRLYVQMTYDVEFLEAVIKNDKNRLQEEMHNEIDFMRKFLDKKCKDNSIDKLKYLIENIKEMLIKISDESKNNSKIKDMLRNKHRKIFAEIVILIDDLELVDIDSLGFGNILDDLGFSKVEQKELYEKQKSYKRENKLLENEENKMLDEFEKARTGTFQDITLITGISEDVTKYGTFSKDNDKQHTVCKSDNGKLIVLSSYKTYQNNQNESLGDNLIQLDIKEVCKYEFQLEGEAGDELSITFFGEPNLEKHINQYGSDYLKAIFLAILAAKRNKQVKREYIGSIEQIDEKIFKAVYDNNLEQSIKQLANIERKMQEEIDKDIDLKRDEQKWQK